MTQPFLAFDVGNTRVKCALFDGDRMVHHATFKTHWGDQAFDYEAALRNHFGDFKPHVCLIASVVCGMAEHLQAVVHQIWQIEAIVVTSKMNLGISVAVPRPEGVGIDRLLEGAEAFRLVGGAVVVATLGSAVTVDLVTGDGVFRGGTILPGMRMGLKGLHAQTSLLPEVSLGMPESVLGTDTVSCMRAGVVYGTAGAVVGIYQALRDLSDHPPKLVVTGGDADVIAPLLQVPFHVMRDLVLHGLVWVNRHLDKQQKAD